MMPSKKILTILFPVLLLPLLITVEALSSETKLIFPVADAMVTVPELRIIGLSKNNTSVKVTLKNSQDSATITVPVENNAFHQLLTLAPGKNTLTITASDTTITRNISFSTDKKQAPPKGFTQFFLHSKNELTSKCESCHILSAPGAVNYQYIEQTLSCITNTCHNDFGDKQFKHGPFANKSCVECHNPHGTFHKNFLLEERGKLCFKCHSEAEGMAQEGEHVHFPVKKGECLLCHDPHQSNLAFHLKRETILELCMGCHNQQIIQHEYMHEPAESGDCNACHSPHTSNFKGLLYLGGKDLCLTCHEVRKEEFESKYVHEPVSKDCNICHDPHGSNIEFHLRTIKDKDGNYIKLEKPLMESCLVCHRKLDPEVAQQIEHSKVPHKPVAEGKCTICHTPHSTNYKKQLNKPLKEICYECHPKIKKNISESLFKHGPVRTDDCAQCHLVHGSSHKELLRSNFSSKFSAPFDLKNFELCFNCHNQKVVTEESSKDTGFRNGTTNLHFLHVNRKKNARNCKTCHDIHASNQEKHIRATVPYKKNFTISIEFTKTATGGGCVVGCHKPKEYDREKPVK